MKLVLAETKLIKEPITIISDLVTEAKFRITKNNIEQWGIESREGWLISMDAITFG